MDRVTKILLDCLGLEASEKAVLLCMLPSRGGLLRKAAKELWLDVPGRGVMMAVPVSSIGGAAAKDYLLQGEAEDRMEKELTHELIVVIANQGAMDRVMDAARAAGATGGTAVHAKGTGTELAKKFFGVSLAAEKELIFILSAAETRKPIMKAMPRPWPSPCRSRTWRDCGSSANNPHRKAPHLRSVITHSANEGLFYIGFEPPRGSLGFCCRISLQRGSRSACSRTGS